MKLTPGSYWSRISYKDSDGEMHVDLECILIENHEEYIKYRDRKKALIEKNRGVVQSITVKPYTN